MIRLYDSAFSPFARKVRIVLALKGLAHEVVDGLALANRQLLAEVNGRVEVPALEHDGVVVVGSSDIAQYLERMSPTPSLYPQDRGEWVRARAWERCADTLVDGALINISYWAWAERSDHMPDGMLEAARRDMEQVYEALERDLDGHSFVCGQLSIADIALFPHLTATKSLGVGHDPERHPKVHAWLKRLRALAPFAADLERARAFVATFTTQQAGTETHERKKIFWRGDRLEWVLARGFHGWLSKEIAEDRVLWPGLGIPGPRRQRDSIV